MSTTKHREVAKLDRVPLPVEAARIGATGWQVTRTGARVVTKLAGRGSLQQKVIKQIPQTFADLGPHLRQVRPDHRVQPRRVRRADVSREFRSLLDRVPPADTDEVHKLFNEELGDEPANLFKTFDEEPFASASIAQVHYATLHTGEEVVVKIQRPGIRRRVAADLQILKRGAQLVELAKLGRRLSAQDVVADFADNLAEELDFRLEAQSMDAWVSHMHASPLGKNIRVPQVYWDLTSERVLTMERIQGVRIDDVAAIRKAGFDGTELVKALLFSVFEGGLRHGLFHGDLHAGNLYVDDDGKIVFFDFGIMGRVDPRTRWLLRELVYALLVKKDHAAAGKIVVLMGAVGNVKPGGRGRQGPGEVRHPADHDSRWATCRYAEIGKQLSTLADAYDVKLPRELVLIGKQFLYVERYMKLLAPKWQMMSDPQLTGYFANFMVEVSREHKIRRRRRGLSGCRSARAPPRSGDLDIYYEDMGDPNDPAVLLIMGLGAQLLLWRKGFCEKLVNQGLRVIRYDNRDVGLSSKVERQAHRREAGAADGAVVPGQAQPGGVHARRTWPTTPPRCWTTCGIEKAHIVGASMGGMIAQIFAARYQHRTKTLGGDLLQQQPGAAAAARPQATARHHARGRRTPRATAVIANAVSGQQDHRQPGLPGARGAGARRRRSRATTGPTTPRAWPGTSARSSAAAACCTTTGRSPRRPW